MAGSKIVDPAKIFQLIFDNLSESIKVAPIGFNYKPVGSIATAVKVGFNTPVMIYNPTNAVAFVAFGDSNVAAPASAATGIPVLPNEKAILSSGPSTQFVIASAALFAYIPQEV